MANIPPLLSNWEADRLRLFQGNPATPGEWVDAIWKWWRRRRVGPLAVAWWNWERGEPFHVNDEWHESMMRDRHLPARSQVRYNGVNAAAAEMMANQGSHVIVEMLDTVAKKRRRVILVGNVLVAYRDCWDASKTQK